MATEKEQHTIIFGQKKQRQLAANRREKKTRTAANSTKTETAELWPLRLPGIQHALVASVVLLTDGRSHSEDSMEDFDEESSPPELLFLCDSFLNSIQYILGDLSQVISAQDGKMLTINDDVLISLGDARLFAVAVTKLRQEDQKMIFSRFVDILHQGIVRKGPSFHKKFLESVAESGSASHFVARCITLCASLADVVLSPDLRAMLWTELESTNYSIARLKLSPGAIPDAENNNNTEQHSLFNKEVYQNLFADWQSPAVPYAPDIVSTTEMMHKDDYKKLEALLHASLEVGFEVSSKDECHLLFSSWNAAAKLCSWTSLSWDGPASASAMKKLSSADRILQLREDMCGVYDLIKNMNNTSSRPPESLLLKVIQSKASLQHRRPNEVILSGLNSAEKMIASLTVELGKQLKSLLTSTSPSMLIDTANFAYYEALPLYISFLVSMHSRPGTNDMGSVHRFQTSSHRQLHKKSSAAGAASHYHGNFSENSDLEMDNASATGGVSGNVSIVRRTALARLHESCLVLGAAPCHPDWLDGACRMQGEIVPPIAVDSADRALLALTKFGKAVLQCYFGEMQRALAVLDETETESGEGDVPINKYAVALQLCFAQQQLPSEMSDSFYLHVSSLLQINGSVLKLLIENSLLSGQKSLSGSSLLATSAQRIKGANVSKAWKVVPGEHRANGQWETLLAETLQGSSFFVSPTTVSDSNFSVNDSSEASSKKVANAIMSVNHWRRVLYSVVNAMIPTAALLRFGINDGKGRSTHTMCEDRLPGSIFSSDNHEGSSSRFSTKNEVGTTMKHALSFLSCVSAYSCNDEDLRLATRAAAGHLLENAAHFHDLTSMWAVRISCEAIGGVVRTMATDEKKELSGPQRTSACMIIETSLKQFADDRDDETVDDTGLPMIALDDSLDSEKRTTLLACLGLRNLKVARLIGNRTDLELISMLTKFDIDPFVSNNEDWGSMQRHTVKLLLTLLCGKVPVDVRGQIFVAEMLCSIMDAEYEVLRRKNASTSKHSVVRLSAAASLDEMPKEDVLCLVKNLVSYTAALELETGVLIREEKKQLSEKTARVVSFIACTSNKGFGGGCKIILDEMLDCIDHWASSPAQHHLVKMLCLLSSRFGALNDAGRIIVSLLKPKKDGVGSSLRVFVNTAKDFFEFVASLHHLVNQPSSMVSTQATECTSPRASEKSSNQGAPCVTLKNGEEVSRTCSFVETGEGFTEQHWYNCYTCGLLWDKGCCSLCARVCHKGHDIGYSRKSSFFCDCGAEVATAISENRTPCQCLSPISEGLIRELYEHESNADDAGSTYAHGVIPDDIFAELVAKNFPSECKESLENLVKEAKQTEWKESILILFNQCYQTSPSPSASDLETLFSGIATQPKVGSPRLELRSGEPLDLKRLNELSMVPIRAAKASALQSRLISTSSTSTSHLRKARNDLAVQAMAADNRGRFFIAESSTVLICNAIPAVNVRYTENSQIQHLTRSQLSILGSDTVKFPINGMSICEENQRHILIWGVSKACVAILSKGLDSFEKVIELKLNLDSSECESEYLVKCDWMPQSEVQIVAVCGTVVHVFDLKRTETNCCNATTHYALAYEDVLIRSATLIGSLSVDDGSAIETKLALLLDTGRLYFISLTVDEEGNLEDHGESYIEIGAGVSFPTAGIRRYCGGEPVPKGSTATTFGEGVFLAYLRQSNLLLYQCVSSCCIAMLLDDDGGICGSFELLPNMISSDDMGGHYGVSGPYTHFQELGIVRRGEETFYKVACVGRSTRSTQPRALVLEFNEKSVSVRELSWPTNCSPGLGFISSYNFVGSCTFSCPFIMGENASDGSINDHTEVSERAFLTLLSSSGSLLMYGEDFGSQDSSSDLVTNSPHNKPVEIGFFENLVNISELAAFGGDFAGKDPKAVKKKLSLNNTDYVICPARDGCTLTVGLPSTGTSSRTITERKSQGEDNTFTIIAIRILVGSMPDLIPREIVIMGSGRSIKLKKNTKRWYDFTLTDEETLLATRNGFVTIWISPCHDLSSAPIIDSVEVYAKARSDIAFLKSDLMNGRSNDEGLPKSSRSSSVEDQSSSEMLVSCIQSLTFLTQIMGSNKMGSLSAGRSRDTISHIIEQTALDSSEKGSLRDQTIELLSEAEGDVMKRTFLIDEATLHGLMSTLQGLGKYLRSEFANVDVVSPKQEAMINSAIEMFLEILNTTISIARTRGGNYRKVITEMIASNQFNVKVSMALEGKNILDFCHYLKTLHGANLNLAQTAQLVSELILMEIACSDSNDFAQFDTLAEYLVVDSKEIVKACCSAISSAIGGSEGNKRSANTTSPEKELAYITYQCDACLVFPITERRYTLGGDEMDIDIDLCKKCYELGIAYARTHDHSDPVRINGRTLSVENEDMTCGKIWSMTSKPIAASSLEQAEKATKANPNLLNTMTSPAKEASSMSCSEGQNQGTELSCSKQGEGIEVVKTEGFRSQIFTQLLGLMSKSFDAINDGDTSAPSSYVLQLVVDLVLDSCTEELKSARGKEMVLAFTKNIPKLVRACQSNDPSFTQHCSKLVVSLRSLATLVLQKRDLCTGPPLIALSDEGKDSTTSHHHHHHHHHHKDKTDPRFICEVHGVPAVRRRCSHGVHKDRRFYVCGLERRERCNYFKWSSDIPESSADTNDKSQDENQIIHREDVQDIFLPVQLELQRVFSDNELQKGFCDLISGQFEKNQAISTAPEVPLVNEVNTSKFPSLKTEVEKMQDMDDGVCRTLEKFGKSKPVPSRLDDDDSLSSLIAADGTTESFLSSSLDLFSLLAPKRTSTNEVSGAQSWSSEWFSVLCEIISTGTSHVLRHLAKSMLQSLCGGRQEIYHRVRDHYVYGFQFRKLLQRSQDILDSSLVVREQARQCGPDWREEEVMFETLPAPGLLGVEDLISEDCYSISTEESITTVLDELLSAAGRGVGVATKARSNNWRQFCGLPELVLRSTRHGNSSGFSADIHEMLEQIYRRPPIVSLLWLSSCLRGSNQVKALSLTAIALEDLNTNSSTPKEEAVEEEDLLVGGYQTSNSRPSDPEQCLLKCFEVEDLLAFIKQLVLHGRSKDLRSISSNVARKLASRFTSSDKNRLFSYLINGPYQEVGTLGMTSNIFCDLLRLFVECFGSELDLSKVSTLIVNSFMNQMTTLNHYYAQNQGLFAKSESDSSGLGCDLSNCVHCHKQSLPKKISKSSVKKSDNSSHNITKEPDTSNPNFLSEQVRPYQRGRLEASSAASVSSEFSSFNQLKFRVALSQVHVTVSDPRGRLVKTIGIYFSPRQVSDANVLKSNKYAHLWQRCGTLNLSRGSSEASCKLKTPVIAANLKFTYEEFYEKASSKRAPDGSFILYCPRCTRQVHNAHGVCGNCGEVAFQCRKCRHINYDRLDAFLCVECGYCTSGGFSYELTAGIALNAIAILDEDGFQRSMAMLRVANKRQSDLRNSLKKKVTAVMQQQRKLQGDQIEDLDELVFYGPHLKRALTGSLPKSEGFDEDDESHKKSSGSSRARGSSSNLERVSTTSNRTRSLLSLARSLRAEGNDGLGSRGDFLRQALLSAGTSSGPSGFDSLDDSDLLNALSASGATSSGSDPLSRIVANIHARARDEGRSSRAGASGSGGNGAGGRSSTSASRKDDKSKLSPLEERQRLYTQMREAERECYELNRRIDAWNRLNKDCLTGFSSQTLLLAPKSLAFIPSTCSACSMQVTHQILSLLHEVYCANILQSEHTVSVDLIKILLHESDILSPRLKDLKRRVIITLASTSEVASTMILAELRLRLSAVQDITSAEILGKLVQLDFPSVDDYIELAMETLSKMQGNI